MKTYYTIAQKTTEVYGHGDSRTETKVYPDSFFGSRKYPPLFSCVKSAEDFLKVVKPKLEGVEYVIIPLTTWV